jgi:hypothetical protein
MIRKKSMNPVTAIVQLVQHGRVVDGIQTTLAKNTSVTRLLLGERLATMLIND